MKIGYLILANNQPAHFGKLKHTLYSDSSYIILHIAKKVDIKMFEKKYLA